ncbi:hypothetical protein D8M34_06755 [Microbacterium sp. HSID17254]|uniref:hypothetical protein n=1 Tax=Microbacterium sp. HSID17254 TaxID=2419509 RepID=UPI000F865F10|nr:hypothetical protein [Microbacterium sp. HSID17254]RUQ06714.1 hypothetical protein D8M34_06755 [Microbacterium sp. HSID17254]
MNEVIIAGGSVATMLLILGILIAIAQGIKEALEIIAIVLGILAGSALIVLFWAWVAGAFA